MKVTAPVKVYGDVHGQLRDLILLFNEYGMPFHRCAGAVPPPMPLPPSLDWPMCTAQPALGALVSKEI